MATTVHEPPQAGPRRVPDHGNGGGGNLVPADGDRRLAVDYSPPPSSTAIWVVLFAISMMFARLPVLWSFAKVHRWTGAAFRCRRPLLQHACAVRKQRNLGIARRRIAHLWATYRNESAAHRAAVRDLVPWRDFCGWSIYCVVAVEGRGLYLATNPSSSFFYVLTVTHALHLLGGLGGIVYVIRKLGKSSLRRSTLDAAARYWHFIDLLWLYLLLLLWMKL